MHRLRLRLAMTRTAQIGQLLILLHWPLTLVGRTYSTFALGDGTSTAHLGQLPSLAHFPALFPSP